MPPAKSNKDCTDAATKILNYYWISQVARLNIGAEGLYHKMWTLDGSPAEYKQYSNASK